ncbi:MAG: tRNA (adenosine(37)-N6)-threonylcarbamoyltransferase complex dimerization subunit type 1 TsaB [Planctomycetota bacterium]|nr:tRNA (adenosine(37)-N6)-threonylcarbamoyltransferase complex dimerization subunit type 1 TsaB [Planctomycetota bacterium]
MHILALETSGARGGIALADGADLLEETVLEEGMRHGRDLVPAAKAACERAGWNPRRIDLVAVSIGPGSFTGIRIAVTLAKVMAFDTGAKVVAVPSMRVMAENAPPDRRRVAAIVDAKRGGLFASIFERRSKDDVIRAPNVSSGSSAPGAMLEEFNEIFRPALIEPEDLARHLEAPAFILGRGLVKGRDALKAFDLATEDLWDPRPAVVARLGAELAARGEFADPLRLEPIYIRPPDAQEIWERRRRLGA